MAGEELTLTAPPAPAAPLTAQAPAPPRAPASPAHWTALPVALLEMAVVLAGEADDATALAAAERAVRVARREFAAALAADVPLATIAASAGLDRLETEVLAVCAAVELDRRLQRLVGVLAADVHQDRVDVDVLGTVLGPDTLAALSPGGRLAAGALIVLDGAAPLAAARIQVPRSVLWALLDDPTPDPELPSGTEVVFAPPGVFGGGDLVLVLGADPLRRLQAAVRHTARLGFLVLPGAPADDAGWEVVVRQATAAGFGVVVQLAGPLPPAGRTWIERADHLAWALCTEHPLDVADLPGRDFVEVTAEPPPVTDVELRAVFGDAAMPRRRPAAAQLRLAARLARPGTTPAQALARVAGGTIMRHARRITPRVRWDDLVLPPGPARQLCELVDRYRHRGVVHEQWGLPAYPSPGVVALFAGPSGTGKSTAAEVIAGELAVDLFRVDLSALVSKYIGETEKNLEEIFSAAHTGDYLLLFDEADALFGARSKVNDARDRYANMEVSYLLQRLETYDGLVVLTSNFQGNIDPAFLRRLHVTVAFATPTAGERRLIWDRCLGRAPRDGLDLEYLADAFDLTGGSIRNAALTAASFAAAGLGAVGMVEALRAIRLELTKLGRRIHDEQFGPWRGDVDR